MRASTFMGAVVIFVLILSAVTSSMIVAGSLSVDMAGNLGRTAETQHSATRSEFPNVKNVNVRFSAGSSNVELKFVDNSDLLYKAVFNYRPNVEQPIVTQTLRDGVLTVSIYQFSGSAAIILGSDCNYNIQITMDSGGFTVNLDENAHVETLSVGVNSGGGTVILKTGALVKKLDVNVTSGGVALRFNVLALKGGSAVNVQVGNGGVVIPPLNVGGDVGIRFNVKATSGGISVNHKGLRLLKLTSKECVAETLGFDKASSRVYVNIQVGSGGVALNQRLPVVNFPAISA